MDLTRDEDSDEEHSIVDLTCDEDSDEEFGVTQHGVEQLSGEQLGGLNVEELNSEIVIAQPDREDPLLWTCTRRYRVKN